MSGMIYSSGKTFADSESQKSGKMPEEQRENSCQGLRHVKMCRDPWYFPVRKLLFPKTYSGAIIANVESCFAGFFLIRHLFIHLEELCK